MILLIDNYDSFTYNLLHYLLECGAEVEVRRNDALSADEALAMRPAGIVVSPGPGTPDDSGIGPELMQQLERHPIPMLGVCLGHQLLGQHFGGRVIRHAPMHGKISTIHHTGKGVFHQLANPFEATRYHSLIVERDSLPAVLEITAETEDGIIMGLQHKSLPFHGVQFHPESIASEHGHSLLANFLHVTREIA